MYVDRLCGGADPLWKMLDDELADIVGMDKIKKKLKAIAGVLSMHYDQRSPSGDTQHARNPALKMDVVLQGNPGTGKTTIARLLGKIFFHLNLTSTRPPTICVCGPLHVGWSI